MCADREGKGKGGGLRAANAALSCHEGWRLLLHPSVPRGVRPAPSPPLPLGRPLGGASATSTPHHHDGGCWWCALLHATAPCPPPPPPSCAVLAWLDWRWCDSETLRFPQAPPLPTTTPHPHKPKTQRHPPASTASPCAGHGTGETLYFSLASRQELTRHHPSQIPFPPPALQTTHLPHPTHHTQAMQRSR